MNSTHLPKRCPCSLSICNKGKFFRTSGFFWEKKPRQQAQWSLGFPGKPFFVNVKGGPCQSTQFKPGKGHFKTYLLKSSCCFSERYWHGQAHPQKRNICLQFPQTAPKEATYLQVATSIEKQYFLTDSQPASKCLHQRGNSKIWVFN